MRGIHINFSFQVWCFFPDSHTGLGLQHFGSCQSCKAAGTLDTPLLCTPCPQVAAPESASAPKSVSAPEHSSALSWVCYSDFFADPFTLQRSLKSFSMNIDSLSSQLLFSIIHHFRHMLNNCNHCVCCRFNSCTRHVNFKCPATWCFPIFTSILVISLLAHKL